MRALESALVDYLALRRAMGFKLRRDEKLLVQFIDHCHNVGAEVVTIEVALQWASLPESPSPSWAAHRLGVVRGFARHLALLDDRHQVIPASLLTQRSHRAVPYPYTEDQVTALMVAARSFRSPMRQASFEAIVGLLWTTGMRIGEAFNLDCADVDLAQRVITVRGAKFNKSRQLPIHDTTGEALRSYATRRGQLFPHTDTPAFFLSAAGTRVLYCNFHLGWLELVRDAGLEARSTGCRPRPHDLRHAFAVRTLVGWYRQGVDVEACLPLLSTYLGHVHPAHTYWYLSAAPELLGLAAARLEMRPVVRP